MDVDIVGAHPGDLNGVLTLLDESGLPRDGVAEHFGDFLVAHAADRVLGVVGLEHYGACALLRSLAVAPTHRGRGLGAALTRAIVDRARASGVESLVLLTTTAAGFFSRLGFRPIARDEADAPVRGSVEFTTVCDESATCMRRDLQKPTTIPVPDAVSAPARVHVHMAVSDLGKSRAFYEAFFGSSPVKVKPGYLKFLPPWGPLNLALSDGHPAHDRGHVDHMGIQLGSRADVERELARVKAAGLPVREEMSV